MHRRSARWHAVAPLLVVVLSFSACVARPVQHAEPHWVRRGEGVFWDTTAIYGVGTPDARDTPTDARPIKILRQTADRRARAQVATALDAYVGQLFQPAGLNGNDSTASADAMQAIHTAILSEGVVAQRWVDPFSEAVYSLFRIDRQRISGAIMTAGQRDEAGMRRVAAQADAIFERLRQQGAPWR